MTEFTFATIKDEHLVVSHEAEDGSKTEAKFAPTNVDFWRLVEMFNHYGITDVFGSSSCDYPEEDGLPGFDARGYIAKALSESHKMLTER